MSQLNQEHAEIRLSAFQIVDQLFARSHLFRTLLVSNFQEFLELTVETDYDRPLPPPMEVDFQDVHARTLAERKRAEERQKRLDNIYKDKAQKAEKEMKDTSEEMQSVLTELDSCFQLLVPDPLDFTFNGVEIPDWRRREAETNGTCSSAQVANQPGASMDHSQQPCCSKDLPRISPVAEDSDRETEKDQGLGDSFHPGSASLGLMGDDDPALFLRSHGLGSYKYALSLEVSSGTWAPFVFGKLLERGWTRRPPRSLPAPFFSHSVPQFSGFFQARVFSKAFSWVALNIAVFTTIE
ncbi:hypothetical protein Chor_004512 [Crotalus horridus]